MQDLQTIWVYLSASPLLHLTLTLAAFQAGMWCYRKARLNPLLNPVLIAVLLIVSILLATGTKYQTYFDGAQFVHFLLGPTTVAWRYRFIDSCTKSAARHWPLSPAWWQAR